MLNSQKHDNGSSMKELKSAYLNHVLYELFPSETTAWIEAAFFVSDE